MPDNDLKQHSVQELVAQLEAYVEEAKHSFDSILERIEVLKEKVESSNENDISEPVNPVMETPAPVMPTATVEPVVQATPAPVQPSTAPQTTALVQGQVAQTPPPVFQP